MTVIRPLLVIIMTKTGLDRGPDDLDADPSTLTPEQSKRLSAADIATLWDRVFIKTENGMIGNITALEYARTYFAAHVRADPFYTHLVISYNWDIDTVEEQEEIYDYFFGADNQLWTDATFAHYEKELGVLGPADNGHVFMFRQDFIMKNIISLTKLADLDTELLHNRRKLSRIIDNHYFKESFNEFRETALPRIKQQEEDALTVYDRAKADLPGLVRKHEQKQKRSKSKTSLEPGISRSGKRRSQGLELLRRRKAEIEDSQQVTIIPKGVNLTKWGSDKHISDMPIREFKIIKPLGNEIVEPGQPRQIVL